MYKHTRSIHKRYYCIIWSTCPYNSFKDSAVCLIRSPPPKSLTSIKICEAAACMRAPHRARTTHPNPYYDFMLKKKETHTHTHTRREKTTLPCLWPPPFDKPTPLFPVENIRQVQINVKKRRLQSTLCFWLLARAKKKKTPAGRCATEGHFDWTSPLLKSTTVPHHVVTPAKIHTRILQLRIEALHTAYTTTSKDPCRKINPQWFRRFAPARGITLNTKTNGRRGSTLNNVSQT